MTHDLDQETPQNIMANQGRHASKIFSNIWIIFAACVLLGSVVSAESIDDQTLFGMNLKDSMHAVVFFVCTHLLFALSSQLRYFRGIGLGMLSGIIFLICFSTGIAIELIQPAFGRHASFLDVWYDIIGTCSAIILITTTRLKRMRAIGYPAALLLISLAAVRPGYYAWIENQAQQALPSLLNFEHNWQKEFYRASEGAFLSDSLPPKDWKANNTNTLKLNFETSVYPGVHIKHIPKDWSAFTKFKFEVYSKQKNPIEMKVRIHDHTHNQEFEDRFNTTLLLKEGVNQININLSEVKNAPAKRELELGQIEEIIFFVHQPQKAGSLYFDNLRLEP